MQKMKFGKNIKNMIVFGAVVIMLASVLSSCGNGDTSSKKSVDSSGTSQNSSSGTLVGDKYINYINSFTDEVGAFVNGDMDKVLNGVGSLSQDNYAEWKALYEKGLDSTEHWYSEVGAAAMLCGEDQKEAHDELTKTVGTIYKIFEGLKSRVEAADNGDFSQLTSMAKEYKEADKIAHTIWEHAVDAVK